MQQAKVVAGLLAFLAPAAAQGATWYVSPTGSDTAAGSEAAPFATWAQAQTAASAGDTVYFRDGTYKYTDATSTCGSTSATISDVVLSKSGASGSPINYWAYPGEHPLFDFSGVTDTSKYSCRQVGVNMQADWLYLKGLEFKGVLQLNSDNHESWCVYFTGGSNNIIEQCDAHHNEGPGFFIQKGGNNQFINDDSHENEDMLTSNGDGQSADGFGCHPDTAGDTGNIFHGCRAWWNSDDGWDFIKSQEACTVEYSWAWYQGYKPDAISGGKPQALAAGNGNGFKAGGYDLPPESVPANPPQHIVRFDVAFLNKANGVYANHGPVNAYFYNNTSYSNGTDFDMLGYANGVALSVGILRNNVAFGGNLTSDMNTGAAIISDEYNSWDANMNITVKDTDFQSVDVSPPASCPATYTPGGTACCSPTDMTCFAGMASARAADGSLPVLSFLRLSATSQLIAKGIDVGLPYSGSAPDLGAFDTGLPYDGNDGGIVSGSSSGASSSSSGAGSSSGAASSSGAGSSSSGAGSSSGGRSSSSGAASSSGGRSSSSGAGSSSGTAGSSGGAASSSGAASSTSGGRSSSSGTGGSSGGASSSGSTGTSSGAGNSSGTVSSSGSSSSAATGSSGATGGSSGSNGAGSSGAVAGGSSGTQGDAGTPAGSADNGGGGGCGCRTVGGSADAASPGGGSVALIALGLVGVARRRRRVRPRISA
jgi:MYXO-CTERM domain-containing protein